MPYTLPSQEKFNENATGSTLRTLADKVADSVSIRDFLPAGQPDGVTDNTTSLINAAAEANTKGRSLLIDCKIRIASAAGTLAPTLKFEGNGALDLSPVGGSVTLTALWTAPLSQIFFTGSGTISLTGRAAQTQLLPQWFGAKGDFTDDHVAIQAAINLAVATAGGSVFFPDSNLYNIGTVGLTIAAGGTGVTLQGSGTGNTVLSYTGSGTAITIGDSVTQSSNVIIRDLNLNLGSATAGANGITMTRVSFGRVQNVSIAGTAAPPVLGTAVQVLGTGNYTSQVIFDRLIVTGNFAKGFYSSGPAVNTSNAHCFYGCTIVRVPAKPGTASIGFHWDTNSGDGVIQGLDVESFDTGYQIDGRFLEGVIRAENNTTAVAFGTNANQNTLFLQPFLNTTLVTRTGSEFGNSVYMPNNVVANVGGGVTASTFLIQDNTDHALTLTLKAGTTAEQAVQLDFLDKASTMQFRMAKNSSNSLTFQDGSLNYKLVMDQGIAGAARFTTGLATARVVTNWAASVVIDASLGNLFEVPASTAIAHAIAAPTNVTANNTGQRITIKIKVTVGALPATTWNAIYKMAAWVDPGNGFSASITFHYDGVNWVEETRSGTTIPN